MGGRLQSVEAFLQFTPAPGYKGHATTWDCAVMGVGNQDALRALRRINKKQKTSYEGSRIISRGFGSLVSDVPMISGRSIPFPGSDRSIVNRSQNLFSTKTEECPIRFSMYFIVQSWFTVLTVAMGGLL